MNYTTLDIQTQLKKLGFDPGPLDGLPGPKTDRAVVAFKLSKGLRGRPFIGPQTLALLFGQTLSAAKPVPQATLALPWMNEINKHMGLHESRNFASLFAWLKSDGKAVGDPRKLPWCGDAVETAVKLGLPGEVFTGRVAINPYLARNWLDFGEACQPAYGAVGAFWRGSPQSISGHVGFLVGRDPRTGKLRVRGGNQDNMVSDTWLDGSRLLGARKPKSWTSPLPPLPNLNSAGQPVSRNEA